MEHCKTLLLAGLSELQLELADHQIEQLLAFIALIEKWNKAYNLTAIRDKHAMVSLHLLDSLAIVPHLSGQRHIDIGTGAGLPGIPLAICYPDYAFTLLDSNAKKTRFVQQAVLELKLRNVQVCHSRVENYRAEPGFDTVITRAFAELSAIVEMTAHLLNSNGVLLAMKGQLPDEPLSQGICTHVPITVPGIDAARCLVKVAGLSRPATPN